MTELKLLSPAKINLFLHIVGRKPNGYHLLQTVFQLISLFDELHFQLRKDNEIVLYDETGINPSENIIIKAAYQLQKYNLKKHGVTITLKKQIPMGGGLGGGSSNAATTLIALNQLWQLNLSKQTLLQIGLQLGADVPIFIFGQSAFAEGIGEILTPIDLPSSYYIIAKPNCHINTAKIFQHPDLPRNTKPITLDDYCFTRTHNDFEALVCRLNPEINDALTVMRQFGPARLTGSGACLFLPIANSVDGQAIMDKLEKTNPDCRYWLCHSLAQPQLLHEDIDHQSEPNEYNA